MLVSKVDLLPHLDFDIGRCCEFAMHANPQIRILNVSARTPGPARAYPLSVPGLNRMHPLRAGRRMPLADATWRTAQRSVRPRSSRADERRDDAANHLSPQVVASGEVIGIRAQRGFG
jgi:hypothetical protein